MREDDVKMIGNWFTDLLLKCPWEFLRMAVLRQMVRHFSGSLVPRAEMPATTRFRIVLAIRLGLLSVVLSVGHGHYLFEVMRHGRQCFWVETYDLLEAGYQVSSLIEYLTARNDRSELREWDNVSLVLFLLDQWEPGDKGRRIEVDKEVPDAQDKM